MITYTITKIDTITGNVSVAYTINKKIYTQVVGDAPLDSADNLTNFLDEYGMAFKEGKDFEAENATVVIDKSVQAIINVTQTVDEPVTNPTTNA